MLPRRFLAAEHYGCEFQGLVQRGADSAEATARVRVLHLNTPRSPLSLDGHPSWLARVTVVVLAAAAVLHQGEQIAECLRLHGGQMASLAALCVAGLTLLHGRSPHHARGNKVRPQRAGRAGRSEPHTDRPAKVNPKSRARRSKKERTRSHR